MPETSPVAGPSDMIKLAMRFDARGLAAKISEYTGLPVKEDL